MGVYSVVLSIGALLGSLLAGLLGERFAVDGLIHGTVAMAVIALLAVEWLKHLAVEEPVQLTYQEEQL
jgi:MFS-type transporter involved in bile tolerance (Atg22 family)